MLIPVHFSPHVAWGALVPLTAASIALALWSYRFSLPPLAPRTRAALAVLRALALLGVAWLFAQPVWERPRPGQRPRVVVLVDRSASMSLPGALGEMRTAQAQGALVALRRALRGRATVTDMGFAQRLEPAAAPRDSAAQRGATALGDALLELSQRPESQDLGAVVVVSDGVVNAGSDPHAAASALGVPVHTVLAGATGAADRAVLEVEASPTLRVGEPAPLRVHLTSDEPRGSRIPVQVMEGDRVLATTQAVAPGPGAQAEVQVRVTPSRPGLVLYNARVDSLPGELTAANNARSVAVKVIPGRLGVMILSAELNWDLSFLRRMLSGDSVLAVRTWVKGRQGWRGLDGTLASAPSAAELRRQNVVVLDGLNAETLGRDLSRALADGLRSGTGVLILGGSDPPGLARFRAGLVGLPLVPRVGGSVPSAAPQPEPGAHDLLLWDDDATRSERAWRAAAPLGDVVALAPSAGDRVLLRAAGGGMPLLVSRRISRGQALLLNGSGFWRWSLAAGDPDAPQRSSRLWRRLIRWLAEPAQGEPLRVEPERLLSPRGETPRLVALLQDAQFRPLSGARLEATVSGGASSPLRVDFEATSVGAYRATLPPLPAGRYRASVRARMGGRGVGRAETDFAVDRWSLEEARPQPDSAGLARLAQATGGGFTHADQAARWARSMATRGVGAGRLQSVRLWEWPGTFAALVGLLGMEWLMRRRRGLP